MVERYIEADEEIRTLDPLLGGDALPLSYIRIDRLGGTIATKTACIIEGPKVNTWTQSR